MPAARRDHGTHRLGVGDRVGVDLNGHQRSRVLDDPLPVQTLEGYAVGVDVLAVDAVDADRGSGRCGAHQVEARHPHDEQAALHLDVVAGRGEQAGASAWLAVTVVDVDLDPPPVGVQNPASATTPSLVTSSRAGSMSVTFQERLPPPRGKVAGSSRSPGCTSWSTTRSGRRVRKASIPVPRSSSSNHRSSPASYTGCSGSSKSSIRTGSATDSDSGQNAGLLPSTVAGGRSGARGRRGRPALISLVTHRDTLRCMGTDQSMTQRSFRLSSRTLELLEQRAAARNLSRNALVDQLLGEAVRTDDHPLIRFRAGGSGRRRPALIGTRLFVHDVIATLRGEHGSVEATAQYLGIEVGSVRAALAYYADFPAEVEQDLEVAADLAREQRARWERQQQALE